MWAEYRPGENFLFFGIKFLYNTVLAFILCGMMIGFWFFCLVIIAAIIQLIIAFVVGISNPIPFIEQF